MDSTTISEESYPSYRRRDDGRLNDVRGHQVDNRWIVPYSPYLLYRFQSHLNVECIGSIKCFKYIHKYIYKGHDRTTMEFVSCRAEVKQYLDARFVSAHEGCWRLFMFDMHKEVPNVVRLQVHLPGEQWVTWNPENQQGIQEVVDRAAERDSTLTAYFKANAKYADASQLLYHEFPQKFTWMAKRKGVEAKAEAVCVGIYPETTSGGYK